MAYTSTMSIGTDSLSSSHYLSSSHSSIGPSKKASSEISKTYKHASQLYLTRRLSEAYESLLPTIRPPSRGDDSVQHNYESTPLAPIALASTSQRIKIWSLYITLLNAVVDLGSEQGKRDFGSKEYGMIVRKVQSGDIWEEVVKNGYQGREGSVDAEVVYNLSNLLLAQAPDQTINQSRLEAYLSSSANPNLDISAHLNNSLNGKRSYMNGASTPKDLSSRIKILELFTLHVLPRNNEWDYARTFVNGSDVLDEERREAFLQTLEELQIAKEQETGYTSVEEDYGQEPEVLEPTPMDEPYVERETQHAVIGINGISPQTSERKGSSHRRTSSEVDYGIEEHTNGSAKSTTKTEPPQPAINHDVPASTKSIPTTNPISTSAPPSHTLSPISQPISQPQTTVPIRRQPASQKPNRRTSKSAPATTNPVLKQAQHIILLVRTLVSNISSSLSQNPTLLFRTLMFVFAFLIMVSRRELRERIKRIMETGWAKVRSTVGMGVKVSYI